MVNFEGVIIFLGLNDPCKLFVLTKSTRFTFDFECCTSEDEAYWLSASYSQNSANSWCKYFKNYIETPFKKVIFAFFEVFSLLKGHRISPVLNRSTSFAFPLSLKLRSGKYINILSDHNCMSNFNMHTILAT